MKIKKIIISIVTVVIAALGLLVFFSEPWHTVPLPVKPSLPEKVSLLEGEKLKDEDFVRWIGRTEYSEGQVYCYYTATGFTVKFTGTELKVTFNATNTESDKNRPYFIASVDNETAPEGKSFSLTENTQTVTVAENLSDSTHTVTVLKRSEPENSLTSVKKIETDGEFNAPEKHTGLKFQILGGSGISGHGCLGSAGEEWTTANSSSLNGFGYLAAKRFGAETQFVSNSGMGLLWSYRGVENLSAAYNATGLIAEYNNNGSTKSVKATGEWNHSNWIPDAVIVNIGGNDWNSHISPLSGTARITAETQFKNAVKDLLTRIHNLYPNAKVVWTCNSKRSGSGALANEAVGTLEFKNSIRLVAIDETKDGADNHAGAATQIANAKTVADAITSSFGLEQIV